MIRTLFFLALILVINVDSRGSDIYMGDFVPGVILDADIDSDVDDVEALAMLHDLADQKKVNFLGLIVTSDDLYAAPCADAINNYFGRPNLPLGVLKGQEGLKNHSRYTRQISEEFPRKLKSPANAVGATALYRKLLSESEDSSAIIVTIGHLTNLQNLLKSEGDSYSPLNGKELVKLKVRKWICMGGHYPEGKEANFYRPDPASTVYCVEQWARPVIFAGWEVGQKITTGGTYLKSRLPNTSPVYRAYQLYNDFAGRASWDQIAVFLLREDAGKYFQTVRGGYCKVYDDGSNRWLTARDSKHEYVELKPGVDLDEIAKAIDDMVVK